MRPHSTTYDKREQNRILFITYLNIVLYAVCYQLQRPVEPFLVQQLANGGSESDVTRTYGQLQSFFSAIQTIGSPLVGILLDRVGVRLASTIVFLASAASYVLLAGATTMPVLFLSKVPTALQHAFLVAQATAAVATADAHPDVRAAALGRMTTAYTIGATIGPLVGGVLADSGDLYAGARMAVLVSRSSVCARWEPCEREGQYAPLTIIDLSSPPHKLTGLADIGALVAGIPPERSGAAKVSNQEQTILRGGDWKGRTAGSAGVALAAPGN
jgi:MFS family permease